MLIQDVLDVVHGVGLDGPQILGVFGQKAPSLLDGPFILSTKISHAKFSQIRFYSRLNIEVVGGPRVWGSRPWLLRITHTCFFFYNFLSKYFAAPSQIVVWCRHLGFCLIFCNQIFSDPGKMPGSRSGNKLSGPSSGEGTIDQRSIGLLSNKN